MFYTLWLSGGLLWKKDTVVLGQESLLKAEAHLALDLTNCLRTDKADSELEPAEVQQRLIPLRCD